ncbi:D-alanine--D-alanine ligase [Aeromicrobium sp.]|nr:D-alanine--D-alanine ligase [Candidatus Saccharibacteria bacterium]
MANIHVISGGTSDERAVSLRSGAAVAAGLEAAGHSVRILDSATIGIDEIAAADAVFLALHGAGGEDGTVQAQLETRDVKFVGTDSVASALCFDKWRYRQFVQTDLPLPDGALVTLDEFSGHPLSQQPFVLKPFDGGSSVDTFIIRDVQSIPVEAVRASFDKHGKMLLEQLIVGIELTVGVLIDKAIGIVEIIPPSDGEFDYENKYNGMTQELCPPEHLSATVQAEARKLAETAHRITGCRDFSRTDLMLEQSSGKLFVLETNTIPGMTDQSLFPKAALSAGITMSQLCDQLVQLALRR